MGYDLQRFQSDVDEELTCPICSGVLEDPVQVQVPVFYYLYVVTLLTFMCALLYNIAMILYCIVGI